MGYNAPIRPVLGSLNVFPKATCHIFARDLCHTPMDRALLIIIAYLSHDNHMR
jgi:hypothetical protein